MNDHSAQNKGYGIGLALSKNIVELHSGTITLESNVLTNMSVNDFIKCICLKRAAQLLAQKQYSVYEVGYMVGFYDRKYFSKEFKKQFGKTPSEFINDSAL